MNWQELAIASLDEVLEWAEDQEWCRPMARCLQDAEWHAEGDVWTHTKMVCRQLPRLDEWESLSRDEQAILIFTALFHDAGKPLTSCIDPVTGRITSPKHALKGEHLARNALRELDCDLVTREHIAHLVRFHSRPGFLATRDDATHEVARLSCLVSNQLLYMFALADTRGRDTKATSRPAEEIEYWKLVSKESGCYTSPYPFVSDHARFTFLRHPEPNLHYVPHDDPSCRVLVMCGVPGSGKDTYLARNHSNIPVVALDQIRRDMGVNPTDNQGEVVQQAREQCREFLRSKTSFAFNATNILWQTRQRWIDLFVDYHARIEIVYVEPPLDRLFHQNRTRTQAVPEKVVRDLLRKIEPPTLLEAHQVTLSDGM
jgi:predicted kinase